MRSFLSQNTDIFRRLELVEKREIAYEIQIDEKFEKLFDAYVFISELIKKAKNSITLIDNY